MNRSAAQRAENESTFRRANEQLEDKAQELRFGDAPTPYLCECEDQGCTQVVLLPRSAYEDVRCECEDQGCTQVVLLPRSAYEDVRSNPRQFVVAPGHDVPPDRVVAKHDGFHVLEKTGEEGRLVEEQDPRGSAASPRELERDGRA
jgi:hypothetical protein